MRTGFSKRFIFLIIFFVPLDSPSQNATKQSEILAILALRMCPAPFPYVVQSSWINVQKQIILNCKSFT